MGHTNIGIDLNSEERRHHRGSGVHGEANWITSFALRASEQPRLVVVFDAGVVYCKLWLSCLITDSWLQHLSSEETSRNLSDAYA